MFSVHLLPFLYLTSKVDYACNIKFYIIYLNLFLLTLNWKIYFIIYLFILNFIDQFTPCKNSSTFLHLQFTLSLQLGLQLSCLTLLGNMFFLKMSVASCSRQSDILWSATSSGPEIAGIVKIVALLL